MTLSVDVGQKLEAFVTELVANGRYGSKSEVLREGLRLVQEREARLAEFDASLARAEADIAAGRVRPLEEVADELRARLLARIKHSAL